MNDLEIEDLLKSYNHQLEQSKILNLQSWALNLQCFETLQRQKAKLKLGSLANFKIFAVCLGILWILFLGNLFFYSLKIPNIFFLVSCGAIMLFTSSAIIVYLYHVALLKGIDNSGNVIKTQETIAHLQLSTLKITRILFLQTPFYCTFWWSVTMIMDSPVYFWLISFPMAVLFTVGSLWLYKNISIKNAHKKWFKILFNSPEWKSLVKANAFLEEIGSFEKGI
ncbi:MAG TPA: hypothetical protein VIJ75_06395 [Hanamia sp.]